MNYLIIGNSAAGIGAIEGIRKVDKTSNITLLSEEKYLAYSRPLIAEYLSDTVDHEKIWYRKEDFYHLNNVDIKLNTKVIKINPDENQVTTFNGQMIQYDKILIATGGTPIIPPLEGLKTDGVFTFIRWDEVKKLKQYKENIKSAVVIGAGLIGLKAAEHLRKSDIKVTIIEMADSVLCNVLDNTASTILEKHFKANGVDIITRNTVAKINSINNKVESVTLSDGKILLCDSVVVAIGVKPNLEMLKDSSIEVNRGILVNDTLQTNYPNVYAAGDVVEGYDLLLGHKRVLPIWPTAYRQGYLAGLNMAGKERVYDGGISMNSLEFFGLPIISAGITVLSDDACKEESLMNERTKVYKKIIIKDNLLIGFIYLNKIDRAGILTGLIRDKVDISEFKDKILSDNFGLIDIPKDIRDKKLSSVVSSEN